MAHGEAVAHKRCFGELDRLEGMEQHGQERCESLWDLPPASASFFPGCWAFVGAGKAAQRQDCPASHTPALSAPLGLGAGSPPGKEELLAIPRSVAGWHRRVGVAASWWLRVGTGDGAAHDPVADLCAPGPLPSTPLSSAAWRRS